jgi:hypothetical protein
VAAAVKMTNGDKILLDISNYKTKLMTLASQYITLNKGGEILGCKEDKLGIIIGKIESLTRFYNNNFDVNGNIYPLYTCPSVTLIRKYINPNYIPPNSEIIINGIDGNN